MRSSILLLDALVQSLSLTHIDVLDPQTSIFPAGRVAALPSADSPDAADCTCALVSTLAGGANISPMQQMMPGWPAEWTEAQIRQDECRRLVWYALEWVTCFSAEVGEWAPDHTRLFLANPFNVRFNKLASFFGSEPLVKPALIVSSTSSLFCFPPKSNCRPSLVTMGDATTPRVQSGRYTRASSCSGIAVSTCIIEPSTSALLSSVGKS